MTTVIMDFESTGTDPASDRIVQYALAKNDHDPLVGVVNPGRPIPAEATSIHKLTDADVADAPPFKAIAGKIAAFLDGCDAIAGFGCLRFDVPLLAEELARAGVHFDFSKVAIIDAGNLFKKFEGRTLADAVRFYCGRDHDGAHDALVDVIATQEVLAAQLDRYEALKGKTLDELAALSRYDGPKFADPHGKLVWIADQMCFNTFRNKGVPVEQDFGYARWIMERSDFPATTKRVLEAECDRIQAALFTSPSKPRLHSVDFERTP